jgi:gamma-glutamyltranspeptidase/glutathione hydrolase
MMAFDDAGQLFMIVGSPGGKTRVETVRQMLVNVVDFGMNIQQAVDYPRFLTSPDGHGVEVESIFAGQGAALIGKLQRRGHDIRSTPRRLGTGQGILIDPRTGTRMGGSDWRQEAVALAY